MLCRDLSETKTVKIQDAEFVIGIIPKRLWRSVSLKLGGTQKMFQKFKDVGYEEFSRDPEFRQASSEIADAYFELVQLGVRGHSNLKNKDSKDIPFEKNEKGYVSDLVVEIYDLNELLIPLGLEVLSFNTATESEKKSSQQHYASRSRLDITTVTVQVKGRGKYMAVVLRFQKVFNTKLMDSNTIAAQFGLRHKNDG